MIDPGAQTVRYLLQGRRYSLLALYSVSIDPSDHEYVESFGKALDQASSDQPFAHGAEKRPRPFN